MKIFLSALLIYFAAAQKTACQEAVLGSITNTSTILQQFLASGKFINELGSYNTCEQLPGYKYSLAFIYTDAQKINSRKYVWGFCTQEACNKSSLQPLTSIIQASTFFVGEQSALNISEAEIEYLLPTNDLIDERRELETGFWVIVSLIIVGCILGVLGIVVEYSRIGNKKLTHEETNFANIDIPLLQEGNSMEQLKQIFLIKDELLRNSKTLWATIILSFSFSRNMRFLFFRYKLVPDRIKHRNAMYFVFVLGFVWYVLFLALFLGLNGYPQNIFLLPKDISDWSYAINHGGMMFGLNMIYLAWGYIMVVSFLNYSAYIPADFFSPIFRKPSVEQTKENDENLKSRRSFIGARGGSEGLDFVKVVHSDNSESQYFMKQQEFSIFVRVFRKYIRLLVPITFATLGIKYIMPFMGDGPIYLVSIKETLLIPCEGSWFLNLLFVQNFMFWNDRYNCNQCHPYMLDTTTEGVCQPTQSGIMEDDGIACKDTCGTYLQTFANIFQFFFIALIIVLIHKYGRKTSYTIALIIIAGMTYANYEVVMQNKIDVYYFFDPRYLRMLTHRPWFRLPSFLTGVLLSLIVSRFHSARQTVEFTAFKQLIIQVIGTALVIISIFTIGIHFIGFEYNPAKHFEQTGLFTTFESALYTSLAPLVFNMGLIMILLPSLLYLNRSNEALQVDLNSLLMYDGWRVLFKISQAALICSYLVIFWYYATTHSNGLMINRWVLMRVTFGGYVLSYALGLIYYLVLDKPIRNLDKLVLFPSKISDSFLIKKAQRGQKAPAKKFKKKFQLMKKGTLSNENVTSNDPIVLRKLSTVNDEDPSGISTTDQNKIRLDLNESVEYNDEDQNLQSQAFSDESEDENTYTYKRAQQILSNSIINRNQSLHEQSFQEVDPYANDTVIRRSSFMRKSAYQKKIQQPITQTSKKTQLGMERSSNFDTEKQSFNQQQRLVAINASFLGGDGYLSSSQESGAASYSKSKTSNPIANIKRFTHDTDPYN